MIQENKKTFFIVKINKLTYNGFVDSELDMITTLLSTIDTKNDWFLFKNERELVIFFSLNKRTREKNLTMSLYHSLGIILGDSEPLFECNGVVREIYYQRLAYYRTNLKYTVVRQPLMESYSAKDLERFNDPDNLYPWQKKLLEIIKNSESDDFNEPDCRTIISIVDKKGKKGKSSFVKWLCYHNPLDIARLSFGTASQLRSAVFNMGKKKCYIIDLPRTKGKGDSIYDLLSVIEDIKNGFVSSSMYGADKSLMMSPPFVIVFSNTPLPYSSLSEDRWELYKLTDSMDMAPSENFYSGEKENEDDHNLV